MKNLSKINVALFLIIAIACIFRLLALNWGLPFRYNDDETNYIEVALRIGIGKFKPEQLVHGTLFPDILFIVYALYFLAGKIMGFFPSLDSFMLAYLRNPSAFSILARLTVIFFSIGSLYLTYLMGKKLFNKKVGALASLFLSFSTVHYMMSTTGLADMVAAFFLLLSFYLLLEYYFCSNTRKSLRYFYLSGFILGLSMAAKLLTAPGIICYLAIFFFKEKKHLKFFRKKIFLGLFFIILGFFLAEPYAFLNPGELFLSFKTIEQSNIGFVKVTPPVFSYLFGWLPNSLGKISIVVFFTSLIYFLFRRTKNIMWILIFPLFHFLCFQMLSATGFAFYLLPSIPFICLTISTFLYKTSQSLKKWRSVFLFALSFLCIFNPALDSLRYYSVITNKDTRSEAKEWIEKDIQSGKSIMLEGAVSNNELVMAPKLNENLESLEDSLKWTIAHGGSGRFQQLLVKNYNDNNKTTYRLYKISHHFKESDVLNTRADYLVTCGFYDLDLGELEGYRNEQYYPERKKVWRAIGKRFILIKKFEPFPKFRFFYPLFTTADFRVLRGINIFKDWPNISPGPEIKIYKRIS